MVSPKALIIDDNPSDRALALRELKKIFDRLEYWEIIDETSFAQALRANKFNLVITDYQLRWTTGLDILERIKEKRPESPVIMFTGTGNEEVAVKAMKAGLDDYVVKSPKHYVRLAVAVRSAWQRSQQQKALEEIKASYDRFFKRVPLGLYRLKPTGEILQANSSLVKMFACSQSGDLLGKNMLDYHLEPESYLKWQQQLPRAEPIKEFVARVCRQDGESIWVRHNAIAVVDRDRNLVCIEGAIADITTTKQNERDRIELLKRERQAKEEAERLNRIKDDFLATLSHELRTPLAAIIGWISLLRTGKLTEFDFNKGLEVIERNAKAQNQLIDDLLDVSSIIRGTMKLKLEPVNLKDVVMASLDTVRPGAEAKNIEIFTQLDSQTILVNADKERLQQVFWNLLINAVKFTSTNGKIFLDWDVERTKVKVRLTDTGRGIASHILPYIFDRFRQAETKPSTRTYAGLGLGLAIVRNLVDLHGGKVTAASDGIGKGATFTVELPLLVANITEPELSSDSDSNSLPSLSGLTLLVVEDEADTREIIALILQQCGAKVIAVSSVEAALIEYQRSNPDILISDLAMPSTDGYSLIQKLRREKSDIPAIALTAYASAADRQKVKKVGFDLHLAKPIESLKLVKSVLTIAKKS
ncbi:MAG: response regulator [Prochloraceae cyanobacterium]|nr:response regulator [Prochloraceae cyanobacterium]